jgi:hypothetical protein
MLIAAVLCLCAAAASSALGVRALARPTPAGTTHQVLRAVAPTQLAAAVMLAAGGVVALSNQHSIGLLVLCVGGAVGTLAAGAWQSARYVRTPATRGGMACQGPGGQRCAACTLSCR